MKLHITKMGSPKTIETKYGPKQKSFIRASEYGENYLNFWCNAYTDSWREGMEVEVDDVTEREYNSKIYHDIVFPKQAPKQMNNSDHEARVKKLEEQMQAIKPMYQEWKARQLRTTSDGNPKPDFGELESEIMAEVNAF